MVKWLPMKWVEVALRGRNRVDSLGKGLGRLLGEGVECSPRIGWTSGVKGLGGSKSKGVGWLWR